MSTTDLSKTERDAYKLEAYGELGVMRPIEIPDQLSKLSAVERVFVYYFSRAGLPLKRVYSDQLHRHSQEIQDLFETLYSAMFDDPYCIIAGSEPICLFKCVRTYLVFLWSNHCQYYEREYVNNKRTPSKMGLKCLTPANLEMLVEKYCPDRAYKHLLRSIFDVDYEPTACVGKDIAGSATNFYERGFTNEHYEALPAERKGAINSFYYLDEQGQPAVRPYGAQDGQQNCKELRVCVYWLRKAWQHSCKYPEHFDNHFQESLRLLVEYLETGDEELFKDHCKEWIKTKSRLDFCLGFIECYKDPMGVISMAGADIAVKNPKFQSMDDLLLEMENLLPYPEAFKRQDRSSQNNCSSNIKLFTAAAYGPMRNLAAYCLPNYDEIRTNYGSKQICYKFEKSISSLCNPDLSRKLAYPEIIQASLPNIDLTKLDGDLWDIQVILHETTGHGSGRFGTHTFADRKGEGKEGEGKEGEGEEGEKELSYRICNKDYEPGDRLPVDDKNIKEFIHDYNSLEEMRAEINALYLSLAGYDDLLKRSPIYQEWHELLGEKEFRNQLIVNMVKTALRRYYQQAENFTEIKGAHSIADVVIMNWLLESGGIRIVEETKQIEGEEYTVLGIAVTDYDKAYEAAKTLCIKIQTLKSEGRGAEYKALVEKYTTYPVTIEEANRYRRALHRNQQAVLGEMKIAVECYPKFIPVQDPATDEIVDMRCEWYEDFCEEQLDYSAKALSLEN